MKKFHVLQYIKYRALAFLLFFIVFITFPFIQYLYCQRMETVWYAMEVVSVLFGIMILFDYFLLFRKHRNLKKVYDNLTVYETRFPKACNIIEEDYEAILKRLYQKSGDTAGELERQYLEQIDYYTMWVHQIKTPISALSLLLQDTSMPQETKSAMEQEVFKIEQYASMVLEYLRIENMNSDLVLRPCMLGEVARKAVKKYATIFIHKRISLNMQELTSKVLTDDKWLSFVIEQLLSNALKYTAKGTIRIYEEKDLECRTCLVIEDTGIGIKQEDIERIFDKGYTGFNGRQNQKSSGIGLYLCKQVANKLSHNIKIESKVNHGTKVSIIFSNENLEVY